MDAQTFLAALDELFELDPGAISPSDPLQEIPGWSSLTFMGLIALVDDELGVTLTPDTILGCRTVGELLTELDLIAPDVRSRAA